MHSMEEKKASDPVFICIGQKSVIKGNKRSVLIAELLAKIKIGIRKCKFYGFILSKMGVEPAEKNLDPVKKMTAPKNRSEVRSVLGVFNQPTDTIDWWYI